VAIPGAIYREVNGGCRTTVDLGTKTGSDKMLAMNFIAIATAHLTK
jgi:hypothetical protein